jgi:hypothetical protein
MSAEAKGAWKVNNESTPALKMHLERASTDDAEARQRLLELTRDRPGVLDVERTLMQLDDETAEWLVWWEEARAAATHSARGLPSVLESTFSNERVPRPPAFLH